MKILDYSHGFKNCHFFQNSFLPELLFYDPLLTIKSKTKSIVHEIDLYHNILLLYAFYKIDKYNNYYQFNHYLIDTSLIYMN